MENMPQMSRRAKEALEVLADGGRFVRRLERGYGGREQFKYRLLRRGSRVGVPGIGMAAFYELEKLGFLKMAHGWSQGVEPYELRKE